MHTKGPWKAEGYKDLVVNSAEGYTICACPGGDPHASVEELQANARLIAAAPELLEACRALIRQEDSDGGDKSPAYYIAEAALEKASV